MVDPRRGGHFRSRARMPHLSSGPSSWEPGWPVTSSGADLEIQARRPQHRREVEDRSREDRRRSRRPPESRRRVEQWNVSGRSLAACIALPPAARPQWADSRVSAVLPKAFENRTRSVFAPMDTCTDLAQRRVGEAGGRREVRVFRGPAVKRPMCPPSGRRPRGCPHTVRRKTIRGAALYFVRRAAQPHVGGSPVDGADWVAHGPLDPRSRKTRTSRRPPASPTRRCARSCTCPSGQETLRVRFSNASGDGAHPVSAHRGRAAGGSAITRQATDR